LGMNPCPAAGYARRAAQAVLEEAGRGEPAHTDAQPSQSLAQSLGTGGSIDARPEASQESPQSGWGQQERSKPPLPAELETQGPEDERKPPHAPRPGHKRGGEEKRRRQSAARSAKRRASPPPALSPSSAQGTGEDAAGGAGEEPVGRR